MKRFAEHCARNRIGYLFATAAVLFVTAAVVGVLCGSTAVSLVEVFRDLGGTAAKILLYVRLPRTLSCLLVGAALSVAGAVIQDVLANKLASPSIVGVNAGAGFAVTVMTLIGVYSGWWMSLAAFIGAFAAVLLVGLGAKRWGHSRGTVILLGVALNSLLNAASDAVITFAPTVGVMSNDFRVGEFSAVTYAKLLPSAVLIVAALAGLFLLSNELEILTLGEDTARSVGLPTAWMRLVFLLLAAVLAGSAVSVAGLLSFVGLLVPHAVRRLGVQRRKHLLPLCALSGGGFVALCDTVARTVFAPYELPVGILMAFLGVPFFVFILVKGKGGRTHA